MVEIQPPPSFLAVKPAIIVLKNPFILFNLVCNNKYLKGTDFLAYIIILKHYRFKVLLKSFYRSFFPKNK
ncbi:MAG: hypothetical protein ACI9XR_002472 [Flavobacterium sp.]|jgi:hypothetical protein